MRKKLGLGQKQVAGFLGHKTIDSISRYEQGLIKPNLENAFKLGLIYQAPLHFLFEGCFESCREELSKKRQSVPENTPDRPQNRQIASEIGEFCTFESDLNNNRSHISASENARRHIAELIRLRSEKMDQTTHTNP